jgi:hypothetical protein
MAELRRVALVTALGALLTGCCASGRPMLLDQICRGRTSTGGPNCVLGGDAAYISGITTDTRAVRLGSSGKGTLSFPINALGAATQPQWSLQVLSAAVRPEGSTLYSSMTWGSCGTACPADVGDVEADLNQDFQWAQVVSGATGVPTTITPAGTPTLIPDDAVITLRGTDLDIVDLRTPGFEGFDENTTRGL